MNLPRPLLTEKAFPEDEAVITTFGNVNRDGVISTQLLFEKRIGARAMVEIELPVVAREYDKDGRDGPTNSKWYGGVGDFAIGHQWIDIAEGLGEIPVTGTRTVCSAEWDDPDPCGLSLPGFEMPRPPDG